MTYLYNGGNHVRAKRVKIVLVPYIARGFTLIELLVVMVILGITTSLLAPDMYSLLKLTQAKTEKTKIEALADLSIERSFFSASEVNLTFEENIVTVSQLTDNVSTPVIILKQVVSEYFVFEKTKIQIIHGEWLGPNTVSLAESPSKKLTDITLITTDVD